MSLADDLIRDEGLKTYPYYDTVGKQTIGVGYNLTDRGGLPVPVVMLLLYQDIEATEAELDKNLPWYSNLPEPVRRGLANMCFQLGWPRLSKFKLMLGALENGHYAAAAAEALDSKWAKQVPARANRIAGLYRSCEKTSV